MPKPPKLTAFRFAVHVVALVLLTPCDAAASFETSYVMEPFEAVSNDTWYFGNRRHGDHDHDSVQLTEDAYVGSRALRLDVRGDGEDEDGLSTADVSVVQTFKPHVCFGAEEISLWYKASTPDARLELTLLDDSECVDLCDAPASLEHWTTPAPLELNQTEEWSERRIPFSDFVAEQVSGQRALDLRRLRGFRLEARSTSAATIQIDHLACIGGGDLFGAALFAAEDAAAPRPANRTAFRSRDRPGLPGRNGWDVEHFSDLSRDRSRAVLRNGTLALDYAVQQTEAWGGYIAYYYTAPGPAYYNLSAAQYLQFRYRIATPVTDPDRAHLRFLLADASHCDPARECDDVFSEPLPEWYYSFHYILGGTESRVSLPLIGGTSPFNPFWQTKWKGGVGNEQLDTQSLKGYSVEVSIDSGGDMMSFVTGTMAISDVEARPTSLNTTMTDGGCVEEQGIILDVSSPLFARKEFVGNRCCQVCAADPECLYVFSNGRDCFLASRLEAGVVTVDIPDWTARELGNHLTENEDLMHTYWMDSEERRGDFCDVCRCEEGTETIDCRGKGLATVPKSFGRAFTPRTLDLRENPALVFLGSGSLADVGEGLRELRLPANMVHLGEDSLTELPLLRTVKFEGQEEDSRPVLQRGNIISGHDPDDYFGSVCCDRGTQVNLTFPEEGLTFCDATHVNAFERPGVDSAFFPFQRWTNPTVLKIISESSTIMSEAAESAEMCAEYCHMWKECGYFSYDSRLPNSEHTCNFFTDAGEGLETVCCIPDHFEDEAMTLPGWTAGKTPETRHIIDNARVMLEPQAIELTPENNYQESYDIFLGSTPLRGSVQVVPTLLGGEGLNISVWPPKVGFFNNQTRATIFIKAATIEPGTPSLALGIRNVIRSCDEAFTSFAGGIKSMEETTTVSIAVNIPPKQIQEDHFGPLAIISTILGTIATVHVLIITASVEKARKTPVIRMAQIEFLRLLLAGLLLISVGAIVAAVPPSNGTCVSAVWLLNIGYTLELIPTVVKVAALNKLMTAGKKLKRVKVEKKKLLRAVALIMVLVVAFVTLWTALDPPEKESETTMVISDQGITTATTTYYCSSDNSIWNLLALGWNALMLFAASLLAFQSRKIKLRGLNEAASLAFMIYSQFMFVLLRIVLLLLAGNLQGRVRDQARSILFSVDVIATLWIYFIPKLCKEPSTRRGFRQGGSLLARYRQYSARIQGYGTHGETITRGTTSGDQPSKEDQDKSEMGVSPWEEEKEEEKEEE